MSRTVLLLATLLLFVGLIAAPPEADARKNKKKGKAVTVLVLDVNRSEGIDLMTASEEVRARQLVQAR